MAQFLGSLLRAFESIWLRLGRTVERLNYHRILKYLENSFLLPSQQPLSRELLNACPPCASPPFDINRTASSTHYDKTLAKLPPSHA